MFTQELRPGGLFLLLHLCGNWGGGSEGGWGSQLQNDD
jgi:hypothetical protein